MWELIALGSGLIFLYGAASYLLSRLGRERRVPSGRMADRPIVRVFAVLTFPLVLLIYLSAALWLLPYVLLSKPYRLYLKDARQSRRGQRSPWLSPDPFSRQLGQLDLMHFLSLPFEPIFAFLDWLESRPSRRTARPLTPTESVRPADPHGPGAL